jgi:hypothetical protein
MIPENLNGQDARLASADIARGCHRSVIAAHQTLSASLSGLALAVIAPGQGRAALPSFVSGAKPHSAAGILMG